MKKETLFILTLLLIGLILRVFTTNCYNWDESSYLQHAEIFAGKIDNYNEFDFRPLTLSLMIAFLYQFWHNPLIANLLVTILSTFSILIIYLVAKEMFDKKTAIIAAILFTFWPIHIYFSKQILVHTTALFFGLLFLLFLKKAERTKRCIFFFLSGVFCALAVLTRFTYLVLIPIGLINLILFRKDYNLKRIIYGIFGFILAMSPYLIWAKINFGDFFYTFKFGRLIIDWSTKNSWFFYISNLIVILGLMGAIGFISWIFFKLKNKKISRNELFLLSWFLFPLIYLSTVPHKEVRYLLIALIPLIIFTALGFKDLYEKIKSKKLGVALFFILILLSLITFNYNLFPRDCNSDVKFISKWIMDNTNQTDIIYAQEDFTELAYNTDKKITLAPFNKTKFLDLNDTYMKNEGYYIYFEKQNKNKIFPKLEDIERDPRFKIYKKIKNKEFIYIFKFKSLA